jgi:HemY protein
MRAALWLMALFAIAVATALFAGNNPGTVTLFWSPHRIDLSLNFFLLLLAGVFLMLHLAMRAMSALMRIPQQARRWRLLQKERAMHTALLDSLSHLVSGRFIRARKAAELVVSLEESLLGSGEKLAYSAQVAHPGAPGCCGRRACIAGPGGAGRPFCTGARRCDRTRRARGA